MIDFKEYKDRHGPDPEGEKVAEVISEYNKELFALKEKLDKRIKDELDNELDSPENKCPYSAEDDYKYTVMEAGERFERALLEIRTPGYDRLKAEEDHAKVCASVNLVAEFKAQQIKKDADHDLRCASACSTYDRTLKNLKNAFEKGEFEDGNNDGTAIAEYSRRIARAKNDLFQAIRPQLTGGEGIAKAFARLRTHVVSVSTEEEIKNIEKYKKDLRKIRDARPNASQHDADVIDLTNALYDDNGYTNYHLYSYGFISDILVSILGSY